MFQHILAPYDGSLSAESTIPHIASLVRVGESVITLLHVIDPSTAARSFREDPFAWQIEKIEKKRYLGEISEKIGVKANIAVIEGNAAETIVKFSKRVGADLIVFSSYSQGGMDHWRHSSVVQKAVFQTSASVMVIPAFDSLISHPKIKTYQKIMVPLDGSQRAETILPYAFALARECNCELVLVHVVTKPAILNTYTKSTFENELRETLLQKNLEAARTYLDMVKSWGDIKIDTKVMVGENVNLVLHEYSAHYDFDLVLMTAHGYNGDIKYPFGSVAQSFISYSEIPMLIYQDIPAERGSNQEKTKHIRMRRGSIPDQSLEKMTEGSFSI